MWRSKPPIQYECRSPVNAMEGFNVSFRKCALFAITCGLGSILLFSIDSRAAAIDAAEQPSVRDGQHDFDFDFGKWKTHSSRLLHPLSGSKEWADMDGYTIRSEEHTSELQSQSNLVCRLLLEKKKKNKIKQFYLKKKTNKKTKKKTNNTK